MSEKIRHDGDCTIYASLINHSPECGICTCGYGWQRVREGDWSEMYSGDLEERLIKENGREEALRKRKEILKKILGVKAR